jgi:16S rRNA A1518/A1519 N6-dimethyltransferase RsmA/KsgA/DIM1 with predicted DNA glycosylase/AP lyase activity
MVRFLFTQRRKKAKKVLRRYLETLVEGESSTSRVLPSVPDSRVYELSVSDFERLSNEIFELGH